MIDSKYRSFFTSNKESWNRKTELHYNSDFYNVGDFMKGDLSLYSIEINELTEVKNKSILHLQCHFGLDSFSWERLGADVTGVDFSKKSIEVANSIKNELESKADFLCANVYDLNEEILDKKFDIIYSSYGAITWLPDLEEWVNIIDKYLKPGGVFYIVDFHPLLICYNHLENNTISNSYFNDKEIVKSYSGTYTNFDANIETKEYTWNHSIGEIINAFLKFNFRIDFFNEFPFIPFNCFPNLVKDEKENNWKLNRQPDIPLVFSLKIIKE